VGVTDSFDDILKQYHAALDEFVRGDPRPLTDLFSTRSDVTLGNPFGPFARGFEQAKETMARAAANYRDGEATGFDAIAQSVASDLAYTVEVENFRTKVAGGEELVQIVLRVTTIYRLEDGVWRVVHRHADPITTARPVESAIQR
jgi:ketosteroid isomerase-like protein